MDGKMIELNEFTKDFLGGTLQGAISPLQGINRNWKELEVKIKRWNIKLIFSNGKVKK
jgi:hypothetical protein